MSKKIRIGTVFSGIGAPEQALKKLGVDTEIVFACDNGEIELKTSIDEIKKEINGLSFDETNKYIKSLYKNTKKINYVKQSYMANYDLDEENWFDDIRFLDGNHYKGRVDILVGGSPCQSFSIIGKRAGLEDTRGTLFYDFARLINQCEPQVFIYENVLGMLTHDHGNTWKVIKDVFNSLGYKIYYSTLNAKDYGIPQDRKRLFVVGFKNNSINFEFPKPITLTSTTNDYLDTIIDAKHYLGKKGFEFVTSKKYKNRARVNSSVIQTQKANQQFNWNGDFIFEKVAKVQNNESIMKRAHVSTWNGETGVIRQLTHRECLRLMGFSDDFKIVVPNVPMYRQAGNSIVVNVLENIFKEIFKVEFVNKKIKLATVFSGIGAIEFAFKRLGINHEIVFACDNGERDIEYNIEEERKKIKSLSSIKEKKEYVDNLYSRLTKKKNYVKQSYLENYPQVSEERFFQDIILLDGKDFENEVDIFVGGSPCQSFSSVGFQGGLEDARGTLFYEYARLVKEIKPKVFIYENVRNLIKHDNGKTWEVIKSIFDSLGYKYKFAVLNSADYGIPQTRRRLFVVGFKDNIDFKMPPKSKKLKYIMKDFCINNCSEGNMSYDDNGEITLYKSSGIIDNKYILSPKLYNYVMKTGTKNWSQKVEINLPVARTLLKTMGNRHRAGVDNYVSFDGTNKLGSVRMLTEREAHRLMGFTDDYKIVVSRAQAYKQAGNSIVVDVLMEIIKCIMQTNIF